MRDYKKLKVWEKAHEQYIFIKKKIAVKFPKEERLELALQLLRASLSVPLNIVEGCGRYTDKDFAHFLDNALGSIKEVDYCCFSAYKLNYITEIKYNTVNQMVNVTRAMLINFIEFLRNDINDIDINLKL